MQSAVSVNPFRCRMWSLHDRLESHVTEGSCRAEIESFMKHGQLVPVLGRPLRGDPLHDVELIYGARRLFVARYVNKPIAVELRELSDQQAIVAMDIENRQRTDISPYERGQSYARWLREGYFRSQDDISKALKISSSQVSRLLTLSRLPSVIIAAFDNPTEICEGWGLNLFSNLQDPEKRQRIVTQARAIGGMVPRPPAKDIYRQLIAASASGRKLRRRSHDDVVKDCNGSPLFRIRQQSQSISLLVPLERVSAEILADLREAVAGILQRGRGEGQVLVAEATAYDHIAHTTQDPELRNGRGVRMSTASCNEVLAALT